MIEYIILFTVIACAGVMVVSFAGFGFALVMVPLLSLFYAPREFLPSYHILAVVCQVVIAIEAHKHIQWSLLMKLLIMAIAGVPLGAIALKHLPEDIISLIIAVLTLTFAVIFLLNTKIHIKKNIVIEFFIGLLSGFLSGSTAQSGPPVVIYGLARQWDKDVFRSTLLVYFFGLSVMTLIWYFYMDMLTSKAALTAMISVPPALIVSSVGIHLKNKINEKIFRRVVLFIIMCVGAMGMINYFIKTFV